MAPRFILFHPVSTVKFHTQFEEKTIVPNPSTYVHCPKFP